MRSASPDTAGIGRTTTSDALGVAKTPSADFFKRDFAESVASKPFDLGAFGCDRRRPRRRYRDGNRPLAAGDGPA